MSIPAAALISAEEYVHLELFSSDKHEFYEGHLVAMAGASHAHLQIQSNLTYIIPGAFRKGERPCEVLGSDLRVKAHDLKYFYPDLTIVCGALQYDEKSKSLLNPTGVIEILSKTTRYFDSDEKLFAYRAITSLTEVALVDSERRNVLVYERQSDNTWQLRETVGEQTCRFFGCELPLNDVYRNVDFQPASN